MRETLLKTRRAIVGLTLAASCAGVVALPAEARAQDVMSKESVAELKSAFLADIETMRGKFVGLAEAFPQDKYTWRPMEGVRSVSEVLMLAAMEGYSFIPGSFGGKPAELGSREEVAKLRMITDKAQIIDHINKGFAHAKAQLESIDPATLTGRREVMRQQRSAAQVALFVGGDLHEHLGQMIAYARMNQIVPPWSK
ncbi:MAG: DinB family protein [Acidobacteriota bacterium]|nr:DinB family protein [Acidobacteriota bacterium]